MCQPCAERTNKQGPIVRTSESVEKRTQALKPMPLNTAGMAAELVCKGGQGGLRGRGGYMSFMSGILKN